MREVNRRLKEGVRSNRLVDLMGLKRRERGRNKIERNRMRRKGSGRKMILVSL